ncbi:MAG: hypothetical protein WCR20_09785, partial [Verrucomicrobiota bacterium]
LAAKALRQSVLRDHRPIGQVARHTRPVIAQKGLAHLAPQPVSANQHISRQAQTIGGSHIDECVALRETANIGIERQAHVSGLLNDPQQQLLHISQSLGWN